MSFFSLYTPHVLPLSVLPAYLLFIRPHVHGDEGMLLADPQSHFVIAGPRSDATVLGTVAGPRSAAVLLHVCHDCH